MEKIKCITFDKKAQDSIPDDIRLKMNIDREKAESNMNKKKERKSWYKLSNVFIYFVRFSDKQITLWANRKQGGTKYQLMIWKDESGVCFKFGKTYGFGSCWETILPKQKAGLVQLKTN